MRKRFDPNEIVIKNKYAEIILYHKNQTERCRSLISLEDVEKIKNERWFITEYNYVRCFSKKYNKYIFLHRYLFDDPKGVFIDHINQDKFDNRRENLRFCSKSQNGMNRGIPENNSSGFKGVCFDKRRKQFRAYIKLDQKHIFLGYHSNIEDAINARKNAEKQYFGKFNPIGETN